MMKFISVLLPLYLLICNQQLKAQATHPFSQAFSAAISKGDAGSLTAMLDDEVELAQRGQTGSFQKKIVAAKLTDFFRSDPPTAFQLKHQGASADGQLYAIGQLTTQSGASFKVLLRAKPNGANQYRIIKLDLL